MRPMRLTLSGIFALVLCIPPARAESPPSPLRLVPDQAELVLQVQSPRRLWDAVASLDYLADLQQLAAVKETLDSTNARRLRQMVAYFEKELGVSSTELLDRLGGGGAVLATKLGDNAPALFVLQGTDEKLMRRFAALGVEVLEQELARQEEKQTPVKEKYQGIETVRIGDDFHAAVVGSALLISNKQKALHKGIDLAIGRGKKSMADHAGMAEATKVLPEKPLATLWLDMDPVRKAPGADALYKKPRDPALTVLLGSLADVLGTAPFLCGGLYRDGKGVTLTFRLPTGRQDLGPEKAVDCPPDGQPGSRPLLEPKGVLLSTSFYWDVSKFWTERVALFGEQRGKQLEEFDKNSGRFLSNVQMSKLLTQVGAYHRLVVVNQPKGAYKKQPKTPIPAFAFVSEMREPDEFAKTMNTVLRGAAFFATTQTGLKLVEEQYKGCDIVCYRFPEDRELKQDVNNIRFAFSPCFVRVGDQFVWCSTLELCRELVDLLQKEQKSPATGSEATARTRVYAEGGAALLRQFKDQFITATVLEQAVTIDEAKAEVKRLFDLLNYFGGLSLEENFGAKEFHYNLRLTFKK